MAANYTHHEPELHYYKLVSLKGIIQHRALTVHKECFWNKSVVFTWWRVRPMEIPLLYQLLLVLVCMVVHSTGSHPDYF